MKSINLLKSPVNHALLLMASPISLGMLSTFLFQVVDTYFVGQLGAKELAVLAFATPIYFLLASLFMGLAVGVSSLVARSLGENNQAQVQSFTTISCLITLIISGLLSIVGIITIKPLFTMLGADSGSLVLIEQYMVIIYYGLPILAFGIVAGSAVRATGNINPPEIIMGIAGVINLVFDYVLIFGVGPFDRLEIEGAAWATFISWVFIGITMPIYLAKGQLFSLKILIFKLVVISANLKEIFRLSLPAIIAQILAPITITFLTFLVAKSGSDAVAAFGIAARIEMLALVGIFAVSVAITPFISQNLGAKQSKRIDDAIVFAGKASLYWGGFILIILISLAEPIARIFTVDPQVIASTKLYFYFVTLSYPAFGILTVTSAIFNGVQIPKAALKILLVKTFLFTAPMTLVGSFWGLTAILVTLSLSNVLGGIYAAVIMRKELKKIGSKITERNPLKDHMADLQKILDRFHARRKIK